MRESDADFAREMLKAFGEDRFYHALARNGIPLEAKMVYVGLGGTEEGWQRLSNELKIKAGRQTALWKLDPSEDGEDEIGVLLCRTACVISEAYKEFALKGPELPANIHARMVLGEQNGWTRRYIKVLGRD